MAAVIAAVVVLPFVAETITDPCGSRVARRAIALRSSAFSTLPGKVVPPPLPVNRESAPALRAARVVMASGIRTAKTSLQDVSPSEASGIDLP
jgi:hypothetical protein